MIGATSALSRPRACFFSEAVYCCGATVGSEQQHTCNQDLRETYKAGRILELITFYHNALHLTTLFTTNTAHLFYQNALRHEQLKIKTRRSPVGERVHRSLPRLEVFFVANFLLHG